MLEAEKSRKYYLYGAGINAFGVMKYLGKENIIGVIDSSLEKIGGDIDGIPIIGMDVYLKSGRNRLVVISAFQKSQEVAENLKKSGVNNFLIAPYMQSGFPDINEFIDNIKERQTLNLIFENNNLLTLLLLDGLIKKDMTHLIKGVLDGQNNFISDCYKLPVIRKGEVEIGDTVVLTGVDNSRTRILYPNTIDLADFVMDYEKFYHNELEKFRNIHKGERCFIIGAGPSLKMEDLDKLAKNNEICFGSNKIFLAYEQTGWRPDYYMVCDFNVFRSCYDIIKNLKESIMFVDDFYNMTGLEKLSDSYLFHSLHQKNEFKFSKDITKYVCSGLTVTYNMIQVAAYMGFKEIYLLGIDFSFNGLSESKGNHFCDKYVENTKMKGRFYEDESLLAYKEAERCSHKNNFRIYNATRGGKLEVFERKSFDDLF